MPPNARRDLASVDWPLRTGRLAIRRATPDDAATTWRFRRLPEVHRWLSRRDDDEAAYTEVFRDPERLATTLVYELDGLVVGDLMLRLEDAWAQAEVADVARGAQAELGWTLDPAHRGRGYATEAVSEVVRLCFEDLGVHRVLASCFADNTASWRLMERLGMRRELDARRDSLHRDLGWVDGYGYALLAEEWSARPR